MAKLNVKFENSEQLIDFSNKCQKIKADTLIEDSSTRMVIDGKSILGMMTVQLNKTLMLIIEGATAQEEVDKALASFACYAVN